MASYGGGGYTQLLGKTKAESKVIIEDLKVSGDLRFLLNQTCLLISTPRYFTWIKLELYAPIQKQKSHIYSWTISVSNLFRPKVIWILDFAIHIYFNYILPYYFWKSMRNESRTWYFSLSRIQSCIVWTWFHHH